MATTASRQHEPKQWSQPEIVNDAVTFPRQKTRAASQIILYIFHGYKEENSSEKVPFLSRETVKDCEEKKTYQRYKRDISLENPAAEETFLENAGKEENQECDPTLILLEDGYHELEKVEYIFNSPSPLLSYFLKSTFNRIRSSNNT